MHFHSESSPALFLLQHFRNINIKMSGDSGAFSMDNSTTSKLEQIDFVLVWLTPSPQSEVKSPEENESILEKRRLFENNLEEEGLILEREELVGSTLNFVKLYAPLEVLRRYTEILRLRMPMKEAYKENLETKLKSQSTHPASSENVTKFHQWINWFWSKFDYDREKFPPLYQNLTAIYSRDKEYLFDIENPKFFTTGIRSRIIQFIIRRKRFSNDVTDEFAFGIERLINEKVYCAAYPLHDGDLKTPGSKRALLREEWASIRKSFKCQPLDYIREYFGVSIGLYFAWLGYYTRMLIPVSILGIFCLIYGLSTHGKDEYSQGLCNEPGNFMCPLCFDNCTYWNLNETCYYAKFTYVLDNTSTLAFSIIMSFWAAIFLEFWKRYSAKITHKWDLSTFDAKEEQPRLEYLARLKKLKKIEKITGESIEEPNISFWKTTVPFKVLGIGSILFIACLAVAVVIAVIAYRSIIPTLLSPSLMTFLHLHSKSQIMIFINVTAAMLNLFLICIFNMIYNRVAEYLTELELHRTQTEFDDSLTIKIFTLQFVNYYSSIFYIAFFKGRFTGAPNAGRDDVNFFIQDRCGTSGCMTDLCIQLAIIMVGKQTMNNIIEASQPIVRKWFKHVKLIIISRKSRTQPPTFQTQWARDYKLLEWHSRSLFEEYLEMIIQYGFVTIFVAAFPLAPFFALLNNILEMRLDATKMLYFFRRPVGQRVQGIGIWYGILDGISRIAVISNAFIIAFTSSFIPKFAFTIGQWKFPESLNSTTFLQHQLVAFDINDFSEDYVGMNDCNNTKIYDGDNNGTICSQVQNLTYCYFEGYYQNYTWIDPMKKRGKYSLRWFWWILLVYKLIFIIIFQNVVSLCVLLLKIIIPDVPKKLQKRLTKENTFTNELIIEQEMLRAKYLACPQSGESDFESLESQQLATRKPSVGIILPVKKQPSGTRVKFKIDEQQQANIDIHSRDNQNNSYDTEV